MTCAMLPLVQSVRKAVTTPTAHAASTRSLELPDASDDDDEEGRDDVGRAERRVRARDQRDGDPADTGQARAQEEGDAVDVSGRDAQRLGELSVLHRRPDLPAEEAVLQHGAERAERAERQHDGEELAVGPLVAEHRDAATQPTRRGDRVALGAEDVLGELLEHQGHTDRREQRVEGSFVHPLDDGDLEEQPEEAGDDEGHRERDHDGETGAADHLLGEVRHVGPDHEELTVRHVDHAHLAERERESERSQQQDGAGRGARQEGGGEYVHRSAFRSVRAVRTVERHRPGVPRSTHGTPDDRRRVQNLGLSPAFGSHQP